MRPKSIKGTLTFEGGKLRFSASGMMIPELCDLIKDATISGQATLDDFYRFREDERWPAATRPACATASRTPMPSWSA